MNEITTAETKAPCDTTRKIYTKELLELLQMKGLNNFYRRLALTNLRIPSTGYRKLRR
ncbi:MAG: hypothetical protein HXS48_07030 [Theionarchaea archaeon]|nr:hypothetical protein [Theionarchaea archaeon]